MKANTRFIVFYKETKEGKFSLIWYFFRYSFAVKCLSNCFNVNILTSNTKNLGLNKNVSIHQILSNFIYLPNDTLLFEVNNSSDRVWSTHIQGHRVE